MPGPWAPRLAPRRSYYNAGVQLAPPLHDPSSEVGLVLRSTAHTVAARSWIHHCPALNAPRAPQGAQEAAPVSLPCPPPQTAPRPFPRAAPPLLSEPG